MKTHLLGPAAALAIAVVAALSLPAGAKQLADSKGVFPPVKAPSALPSNAAKANQGEKGEAPDSPAVRAKLLDELYDHLAAVNSEADAQPITEAIEKLWLYSGSDTVNLLMDRSLKAVAEKRPELALQLLDAVTELAPDFAEGWNRRAYVFYTQNDYERALGDLRRVLALEPNHFKALDGLAQIFKETGNKKAALKAYKELMQINPHQAGVADAVKELSREVEGQGI